MTTNTAPNPNVDSTGAAAGPDLPGPQRPGPGPGDRLFAWLRRQPIRRDTTDRWLGGVCSAIAGRLGVSATVVRIAAAVLALFAGLGVLLYLVAWLLLPNPEGRILGEEAVRTGRGGPVLLLGVVAFVVLVGPLDLPALLAAILVLGGLYLLDRHRTGSGRRHTC